MIVMKGSRLTGPSREIAVFLAGVCVLLVTALMPIHSATAAESEPHGVRVGVAYVPPPFVDGAKVRTPESTDTFLAYSVAEQFGARLELVATGNANPSNALDDESLDLVVAYATEGSAAASPSNYVATGHKVRRMAIMRSDTDIKSWEQLKARTVCVAVGGLYQGTIAPQFGATEIVYGAPADALLALRVGECDAAVLEEPLLRAIIKLPEWKKFSATLPADQPLEQVLVVSESAAFVRTARQIVASWHRKGHIADLILKMANDIAFEVYLDQTVPDCH